MPYVTGQFGGATEVTRERKTLYRVDDPEFIGSQLSLFKPAS